MSCLITPPEMTHNDFDFLQDILNPIQKFLLQYNVVDDDEAKLLKFDEKFYTPPAYQKFMK